MQTPVVMLVGFIALAWAVAVLWIRWLLLLRKPSRTARIDP
jgi:hypothetical protein